MKYRHEFHWGLALTAVSAAWLLIQYFTGLHSTHIELHPIWGNLWIVFCFLTLYFSLKNLREKNNNGFLSFWEGVQSGTLVAVISIPMHLILYILYYSTIGSVFFDSAIALSDKLGMPKEEAEMFFSLPSLLFRETISILAAGFILSLIASMFLIKEMPDQKNTNQNSLK